MSLSSRIASSRSVHMVGVCGTGMSNLAMILRRMGKRVSGTDRAVPDAPWVDLLRREGVRIDPGHDASRVPADCDLLIASAAIGEESPERKEAARRGVPFLKYAQALAEVAAEKKVVAVAGSHGKTTTSSWIAWVLDAAGVSSSYLVGSRLADRATGGGWGKGDWFTLEACEYDRSFLNYAPTVAVITNVDRDHMDYYGTFEAIAEAFARFAARVVPEGKVILTAEDPLTKELSFAAEAEAESVGLAEDADWRIVDLKATSAGSTFGIEGLSRDLGAFSIERPGLHNVRNAAQALVACLACGAPLEKVRELLPRFPGAERRLQRLGAVRGAEVYDDYGHHPVELAATFQALRQRHPGARLRVLFQPHQFSRTEYLFDDFAKALAEGPDETMLAPIYGARHDGTQPKVDIGDLAKAVAKRGRPCAVIPTFGEMVELLGRTAKKGEVILILGAGDIEQVGRRLIGKYGAE